MKQQTQWYAKYFKLLLYVVVVVLINLAGASLFFRTDLTRNRIYSLSPVSRKVVATLHEPLTVKVFFTKDLPAPHNNTEVYLHDLLNEYAQYNSKYFKVQYYNVTPEEAGMNDNARANREMARDYGINPVQIQMIEGDELKFKQAYMGLAMIHGDVVERIGTITSTDGLEYRLTTAIAKLNQKVSALLNLKEDVQVKLVLSSSLDKVAPFIGIKDMADYPKKIEEAVNRLNAKSYGRLHFSRIDPSADPAQARQLESQDLMKLNWPANEKADLAAGEGIIGLLMQYRDQTRSIPLMRVMRIPIFGTQYQLSDPAEVEESLSASLDRMINLNQDLGYLSDFGTLNTAGLGPMAPRDQDTISAFNTLVSQNYSLKPVSLKSGPIPDGLKCLVIARPTEKFSDYDLYQIDQALMKGTNLVVFTDAFKEVQPAGQPYMNNQMPAYVPLDTGLEKLLAHYGVRIKKSIVLDKNCYKQRIPREQGGGERAIYFAPIIQDKNINKELPYVKNIKALVVVKASPLQLDAKAVADQGLKTYRLFASSDKSWEMRDRIDLNPMFMQPPASDKEMASQPLAYLLEGSFSSYFKGKPMPEKPADKKPEQAATDQKDKDAKAGGDKAAAEAADAKPEAKPELPGVSGSDMFRDRSVPAKIMVVGSSEMLKDGLLDEEGQTTNATFVMNMIDALNGHEDVAAMRSKEQRYNPIAETGPATKVLVKTFNMAGLPVLVLLFGLLVWWRRHARRKRIQLMFRQFNGLEGTNA